MKKSILLCVREGRSQRGGGVGDGEKEEMEDSAQTPPCTAARRQRHSGTSCTAQRYARTTAGHAHGAAAQHAAQQDDFSGVGW